MIPKHWTVRLLINRALCNRRINLRQATPHSGAPRMANSRGPFAAWRVPVLLLLSYLGCIRPYTTGHWKMMVRFELWRLDELDELDDCAARRIITADTLHNRPANQRQLFYRIGGKGPCGFLDAAAAPLLGWDY